MEESPLDQLNVQIPGRLLFLEIVVLLLLHRSGSAHELLQIADHNLNKLEASITGDGTFPEDQLIALFGSARATLDQFIRDLPRD